MRRVTVRVRATVRRYSEGDGCSEGESYSERGGYSEGDGYSQIMLLTSGSNSAQGRSSGDCSGLGTGWDWKYANLIFDVGLGLEICQSHIRCGLRVGNMARSTQSQLNVWVRLRLRPTCAEGFSSGLISAPGAPDRSSTALNQGRGRS